MKEKEKRSKEKTVGRGRIIKEMKFQVFFLPFTKFDE